MAKRLRGIPKGRSSRELKRAPETIDVGKRILIVCEGEKTEPRYLRNLIQLLRVPSAKVSVHGEGGSAPISVVEHAEKILKQDPDFETVFLVFDRDRHQSYNRAVDKCRSLVENSSSEIAFIPITSVPCFEYWLLLHVSVSAKPYGADPTGASPADNLISDLKKHSVFSNYNKSDCGFFDSIKQNTDKAAETAERNLREAIKGGSPEYHEDPSSRVYLIVKELKRWSGK